MNTQTGQEFNFNPTVNPGPSYFGNFPSTSRANSSEISKFPQNLSTPEITPNTPVKKELRSILKTPLRSAEYQPNEKYTRKIRVKVGTKRNHEESRMETDSEAEQEKPRKRVTFWPVINLYASWAQKRRNKENAKMEEINELFGQMLKDGE